MVRVESYTSAAMTGVGKEQCRNSSSRCRNTDINSDLTALNVHLKPPSGGSIGAAWHQSMEDLGVTYSPRKTTAIMDQMVITSGPEFFKSLGWNPGDKITPNLLRFFSESYKWAVSQIGFEGTDRNVLAATIHLDEKTPHMHISYLPVVAQWQRRKYAVDKDGKVIRTESGSPVVAKDKNGKPIFEIVNEMRLSHSEFWKQYGGAESEMATGRKNTSYSLLQDSFYTHVGEHWDLDRGEIGSNARHQSHHKKRMKDAKAKLAETEKAAAEKAEAANKLLEEAQKKSKDAQTALAYAQKTAATAITKETAAKKLLNDAERESTKAKAALIDVQEKVDAEQKKLVDVEQKRLDAEQAAATAEYQASDAKYRVETAKAELKTAQAETAQLKQTASNLRSMITDIEDGCQIVEPILERAKHGIWNVSVSHADFDKLRMYARAGATAIPSQEELKNAHDIATKARADAEQAQNRALAAEKQLIDRQAAMETIQRERDQARYALSVAKEECADRRRESAVNSRDIEVLGSALVALGGLVEQMMKVVRKHLPATLVRLGDYVREFVSYIIWLTGKERHKQTIMNQRAGAELMPLETFVDAKDQEKKKMPTEPAHESVNHRTDWER